MILVSFLESSGEPATRRLLPETLAAVARCKVLKTGLWRRF